MNTMQEEFDAVVAHLYKQGKPAAGDGNCYYRTDAGRMCAVGCRIPDSMYKEGMEGFGLIGLIENNYTLPEEVVEYGTMFKSLQTAHDDWANHRSLHSLDNTLSDIALSYNLTYNSPWKAEAKND